MNMRCDQCKYWNTKEQKNAVNITVSECSKALMWWDSTEWSDKNEPYDCARKLTKEAEGTKMFVQDGSDYTATLYTTADFYCAHFDQL